MNERTAPLSTRTDEQRKVWAVSSGSYSDYSVSALFEREEDANKFADELNGGSMSYGENFVESFDFYPAGSVPQVFVIWQAQVRHDEDEIRTYSYTTTDPTAPERYARPQRMRTAMFANNPQWSSQCIDKEAAIKSVADQRAQWRATEAGV